jgi:hypothetical protein
MKAKLFLLGLFAVLSTSVFAQTYSFSRLIRKANVQTVSGSKYRTLGTTEGNFRFVFETPRDRSVKRLFTILQPGQANGPGLPWYAQISESGYLEKDGKLYKKYSFFDTEREERVPVLIAEDYSVIVIFRTDDTIWEYVR